MDSVQPNRVEPRRLAPSLVGVTLIAVGLGAALGTALADISVGLGAGCVILLAALFLHQSGPRATLVFLGFLGISPGVLGEDSFRVSVVCAAGICVLVLSVKRDSTAPFSTRLALVGPVLLVGVGLAIVYPSLIYVNALCLLLAVTTAALIERRGLLRAILKAFAIFVILSAISFAVSWLLQFQVQLSHWELGNGRNGSIYAPLTVTVGGTQLFSGTFRMVLAVGEPGLNIYFIIPALVFFLTHTSSRTKILGLIGIVAAVAFSQSAGLIIIFAIALGLSAVVALWKAESRFLALAVLGVGGVGVVLLARVVYSFRLLNGAASITDRGIADVSTATSAAGGDINLIVALRTDLLLGLFICVALALLVPVAVKTATGLFSFGTFAATAIILEPSQSQFGAWALIALAIAASLPISRGAIASRSKPRKVWHEWGTSKSEKVVAK
ncbi:hypothetical protein VH571_01585 [Frondihabitans sp. 4ASC-45]|uniref:hypothetical protein n=1 Tax=Frondihabitans sp. 4ASC-45 TaxID=3111636 RepID=UPI003C277844